MRYGELITKDYPIVIGRTFAVDPTIADLDEYFNALDKFLESTSGPYVFISTTDEARYMASETRIHIGKIAVDLDKKYKSRNAGSIIVAKGVMQSVMLKAIALLYKPLKDSIIVKSLDEGVEKAKKILEKELVK